MAPRKRRGRNSAAQAQKSIPSGSATNSSSHSSPPASKFDHDLPAPSALVALNADRIPPDSLHSSKNNLAAEPSNVADNRLKHATIPRDGADPTGSGSLNPSREPSISVDRTVNENHAARADLLLKKYQESASGNAQEDHFTVAGVAVHLYQDLIDWAVSEVAVQFKHNVYRSVEVARQRSTLAMAKGNEAVKASTGAVASRLLYSDKNVTVECSNCSSNISAARYAQHVEKCLGRGGRMSSRAASARLRASAERSEKEAVADGDEHPVRRRRHGAYADGSTDAGSLTGGPYSKRRRMSPVPSAGSGAASHAGSLQHGRGGLPPSGRTRASPQ